MTKKNHYPRITIRALNDLASWVNKFNGARDDQNMGNVTGGTPEMRAEVVDRDSSEFFKTPSIKGGRK